MTSVPLAVLALAAACALPARARARPRSVDLSSVVALFSRAGVKSGMQVTDAEGRPLLSVRPYGMQILASNTKLFTTAAALDRFGTGLRGLLGRILRPSDNVLAQDLSDRLGGGSSAAGARAAERYAASLGVHAHLTDGSGLSPYDRAAPAQVARFLVAMSAQPHFSIWRSALPLAGHSGTLAWRMNHTAAAGRCAAKTGTLLDISALSGYCTTLRRRHIVFSILMTHVNVDLARTLQDRIVTRLVRKL